MKPMIRNAVEKRNPRTLVDAKALAGKDEKSPEDMQAEMQKQMAIIMPLMIGYIASSISLRSLALYWNISGFFGIIQQLIINKET